MKRFGWVWAVLAACALMAYASGTPTDVTPGRVSPEYAKQKAAMGPRHTQGSLDSDTLCNALVCVHVGQDGSFTIGTASGRSLLYGFPGNPWSTNVRVSIDGLQWNLVPDAGNNCAGMATFVNETHDATHVTDNYTITGGYNVTLTQTLVMFTDSSGAVLTRTVVTNNSGATHNIGVLYEYDTMVDDDDAAQLFLGPNRIQVETCYTAPFAYPYWDAIPNSGALVGRGTFTGGDAVTPDALAFGAWPHFYSVCWSDSCSGDPYGDSAVLYRWNEQPVASGQTRNVATYYGVGSSQSAAGNLRITVSEPSLSCEDGVITPNPFQILVSVTDSGSTTCNNVSVNMSNGSGPGGTATITGTNPQIISSIQPGTNQAVSFTAQLTPATTGGLVNFTVQVSSADCGQNSLPFSVSVPVCEAAVDPTRDPGLATAYALRQNYPNPFNPTTSIGFDLPENGFVSLKVYNIAGQEVASLVNGQMERGRYTVAFDASKLPSGLYLYRLDANSYTSVRKMLLMK